MSTDQLSIHYQKNIVTEICAHQLHSPLLSSNPLMIDNEKRFGSFENFHMNRNAHLKRSSDPLSGSFITLEV
jgi:hypothetical protein